MISRFIRVFDSAQTLYISCLWCTNDFPGLKKGSDENRCLSPLLMIKTKFEVPLSKLVEMFPRIRIILLEKLRKTVEAVTRILHQIDVVNCGTDEPFTVIIDNPKILNSAIHVDRVLAVARVDTLRATGTGGKAPLCPFR